MSIEFYPPKTAEGAQKLRAVRAKLSAAIGKAMADPEVLARVRALGGEVFGGGEAEAARFLKAQQALWGQVVRERRITRE